VPRTTLGFYREGGRVRVLEWLEHADPRTQYQARAALSRLAANGHALRRPHADFLSNGIYELRFKVDRVNHRLLYFFHGREVVVVSHHFTKQTERVPELEIQRAILHRERAIRSPMDFIQEAGDDF